jgi:lipoprotein-anchoring transpeptidase ErfK/SrfK
MLDYVPVLSRAIEGLSPNTEEARHVLYDRARRAVVERLQDNGLDATDPVLTAEVAALEKAIERVEAEELDRAAQAEPEAAYTTYEPPTEEQRDWRTLLDGRKLRRSIVGATMALAVLLVCVTAYSFWPQRDTVVRNVASKPPVDDQPATSIGYFYLRQPVYYRTHHPVGTIIVDKSQSFLYVVQPNVSALRYGIGIGPECTATAGLYRIMQKEEWPGLKLSPERSANLAAEQLKNPLGARALYLSQEYRIHGSDGPAWIGRPIQDGCIRLVNDDVIHLYDRAPLETRVVVLN